MHLDINLIMYSNVKSTDLPLGLVPALLLFTLCRSDMVLARSFVLVYKGTLLNSGRLDLDQREIRSERD